MDTLALPTAELRSGTGSCRSQACTKTALRLGRRRIREYWQPEYLYVAELKGELPRCQEYCALFGTSATKAFAPASRLGHNPTTQGSFRRQKQSPRRKR